MDERELLDRLYHELVLGAEDTERARANLDRLIADATDLRDTLELYGMEVVAEAVARANQGGGEVHPEGTVVPLRSTGGGRP